jgi:hypothetical protein
MVENSKVSGIAGVLIFALILGALSGAPTDGGPATWTLENQSWSFANPVTHDACEQADGSAGSCGAPPVGSQCDYAGLDEDGDGLADENDPSCLGLLDTDTDGICDTRILLIYSGLEANPEYMRLGCNLWQ